MNPHNKFDWSDEDLEIISHMANTLYELTLIDVSISNGLIIQRIQRHADKDYSYLGDL